MFGADWIWRTISILFITLFELLFRGYWALPSYESYMFSSARRFESGLGKRLSIDWKSEDQMPFNQDLHTIDTTIKVLFPHTYNVHILSPPTSI
jgi:hypothetical protein